MYARQAIPEVLVYEAFSTRMLTYAEAKVLSTILYETFSY